MLMSMQISFNQPKEALVAQTETDHPTRKLIARLIETRNELCKLQQVHTCAHMALYQHCFGLLGEVFDKVKTNYPDDVVKHAEWNLIDMEELNGIMLFYVRFATKKDVPTIGPATKLFLVELYRSFEKKIEERFHDEGDLFKLQTIFA